MKTNYVIDYAKNDPCCGCRRAIPNRGVADRNGIRRLAMFERRFECSRGGEPKACVDSIAPLCYEPIEKEGAEGE